MKSKNQSKISISKKAQFGTLADVWSFIIWVFVIIIFVIIFSIYFKGCMDKKPLINKIVTDKNLEVNAQTSVINFLRTPVNDKTVADMLIENYGRDNSESPEIEILANKLLVSIAEDTKNPRSFIRINYPDDKEVFYGKDFRKKCITAIAPIFTLYLPLEDGRKVSVNYFDCALMNYENMEALYLET